MVALTRIVAIRLNSSNRASHPALADPAAHRPIRDTRNVCAVGGRLRAAVRLAARNKPAELSIGLLFERHRRAARLVYTTVGEVIRGA